MNMKLHKKWRIALAVSAAALVLLTGAALILGGVRRGIAESLPDQLAARRWDGKGSSQISAFFAEGEGDIPGRIYSLTAAVDQAMQDASLTAPEEGRLWYCAYSTEQNMYARTERDSTTLRVSVIGGEYFLIHQPDLLCGSYLMPGGENAGYVFLDEQAAWKLFGAINVVGMPVTLGDGEYIVCGVGAVPSGTVYDEAYGQTPRAYILFDSPSASSVREISVYEAVLPNPVDGFALDVFEKNFTAGGEYTVVENSRRFTVSALWDYITHMDTLGVRTSPVTYPWWENVAQVAQYRCAALLIAEIVLYALALLLCLTWCGIAWKPTGDAIGRGFRAGREWVEETYNRLTRSKHRSE
ncbi:MAG: ABC transporter permease [Clostridia bacterium]|nr:ABC transporter permease [Clostridia bacterium]